MSFDLNAVVLAAGKGSRMRSSIPKVLHCIGGRSLVSFSIDLAQDLGCDRTVVVIGHGSDQVENESRKPGVEFCVQEEQLGTGHAVAQALPLMSDNAMALVLYGDVPLLTKATVKQLLSLLDTGSMGLLTSNAGDPAGLGRIIRNNNGEVIRIVEEKDATNEERKIQEVNTGIMVIPVNKLKSWLPALKDDNAQGEYYLTDIIAMAVDEGCGVKTVMVNDEMEVAGVNTRVQLAELEKYYQRQYAERIMLSGVTLLAPGQVSFRGDIAFSEDVLVDMNVIFEGRVICEKGVSIGPNCVLKNCEIGEGTVLEAYTHIENAIIGKDCKIGPFARIRPSSDIRDGAKIGNFVETKKSVIGNGSKVNHFSYIGDTVMGSNVNIGAGTIVCNYDGENKHQTEIGDNVFIGSNTALVAPVKIANGATVAAGSTINRNVDERELAIARSRQKNRKGWKRPGSDNK